MRKEQRADMEQFSSVWHFLKRSLCILKRALYVLKKVPCMFWKKGPEYSEKSHADSEKKRVFFNVQMNQQTQVAMQHEVERDK